MQPSSGLVEAPRNIETGRKLEGALQGKGSMITEEDKLYLPGHTRSRCQITIQTFSFETRIIQWKSGFMSLFCLVTVLPQGFNALLHAFARSAHPHKAESGWVNNCHASTCFTTCFTASLLHLITTWPGREVFGSDAGGQGSSRKATQMIQIQHASKHCIMNVKDYYGQIWSVVAWDSRFRDCSVVAVDLVEEAMHEVLKLSNQPTAQLLHSMAWGWHQLQHADWGFGTQKRSIAAVKLNSSWILLDIAGTLVDFSKFPAIILHSRVKNAGGLQMLTRSHESWYGPPQLLSFSIEGSWFPRTFCFLCRVEDYEGEPNSDTKLFPFHTHVCLHFKWTPKAHVRCGDTRQPGHRAESDTDSKHIYLDQLPAELQTFWG